MITGISSCTQNKSNPSIGLFEQLRNIKPGSLVFVIPGSGCAGCISNIEELALENVNCDSMFFLFTKLQSLKIFKLKFKKLYGAKNIIVDSLNNFVYENELNEIYPVKYQEKNNKIELVEYLKP
ncbi:MAG: hypothetical protein IT255_03630 [Chitinophagaceae bacterium]|nr:hypothetical protein [Chitinophagaceae bacterium]